MIYAEYIVPYAPGLDEFDEAKLGTAIKISFSLPVHNVVVVV